MKFIVGALVVLQAFLVSSDDVSLPFSNIMSNSTGNCAVIKDFSNHATATLEQSNSNTTTLTMSALANEPTSIQSAVIVVTASPNKLSVNVNTTVLENNEDAKWDFQKDATNTWTNQANGVKTFKQMSVMSSNYSGNSTFVTGCLNLGYVYAESNTTSYNVTVIGLGCWTWENVSSKITYSYKVPSNNTAVVNWAKDLSKKACSGALSNLQITPILALILALFVSNINKM